MSNPGVCTLVEFQLNGQRFCIEDNIGEAIHIHYGHFRVDLTVEEFLTLADDMLKTLNDIIKVDGLDINQVDPLFLFEISYFHILLLFSSFHFSYFSTFIYKSV